MILYGSRCRRSSARCWPSPPRRGSSSSSKPAGLGDPTRNSARPARSARCRRWPTATIGLADSSAIIHYLEAKHPEPALIPTEPQRARPDDLVRRIRRHHPVRLRRQDVLQPHRRAALPRARGRRGGRRHGRARGAAADPRLSRAGDSGQRLPGRRPADAGRHRGRQPVRQSRPPQDRDRRRPLPADSALIAGRCWPGRASRR